MFEFVPHLNFGRCVRGPIMNELYFHCKNSLDFGSSALWLRSPAQYSHSHLHNMFCVCEVNAPIAARRYFHSHTVSISLNLRNSNVNKAPQYHFPHHAVPIDFAIFYSHLLLFLQPSVSLKMLQYPAIHIDAIVPRVLGDTLFCGRAIVVDYLECAQGLLFPETWY